MTALRTGSNKLRIETGRWKRPQELERERICMTCMDGEIEDEKHFILGCHAYDQLRESLLWDIAVVSEGKWQIKKLEPEWQWRVLMEGTNDKFQKEVAERVQIFVVQATNRRNHM